MWPMRRYSLAAVDRDSFGTNELIAINSGLLTISRMQTFLGVAQGGGPTTSTLDPRPHGPCTPHAGCVLFPAPANNCQLPCEQMIQPYPGTPYQTPPEAPYQPYPGTPYQTPPGAPYQPYPGAPYMQQDIPIATAVCVETAVTLNPTP
jgi:hypothetical protein